MPNLANRSTPSPSMLEEEALLSEHGKNVPLSFSRKQSRSSWTRERGILIWAVAATLLSVILAAVYIDPSADFIPWHRNKDRGGQSAGSKRNIIFMVSDGMGPASLTLTRNYVQHFSASPGHPFGNQDPLGLDTHHIGTSRTRSSSSYVTDSAAGATAFSCGLKSYNGAIAVLDDGGPCGTVLEAAKLDGYLTGLVVTTRITDATPAAFAAHVPHRSQEDLAAAHMLGDGHPLGPTVDLMLGGGACHFLPNNTATSCRGDDRDMFEFARSQRGFTVVKDLHSLRALSNPAPVPLIGLFSPTDIPYEIDRLHETDRYPSLVEMATIAIKALSAATKDSDRGFFLMIEGSRIDHAGHENDPGAQVREVLAYNEAMSAVVEFIDSSDVPTVLVATSDHETGGLVTARQFAPAEPEYVWYPEVLANATHSAHFAAAQITKVVSSGAPANEIRTAAESQVLQSLGISDASEDEIKLLVATAQKPLRYNSVAHVLSDMISKRAHIGWSTHGHSAVDVNIYGYPRDKVSDLFGNHENVEVGQFLARYLDVDVNAVTKKLRANDVSAKKDDKGVPLWMSGGQGQIMISVKRDAGDDHGCNHDHFQAETKRYQDLKI